ncbi:MAG: PUA domain-containing protein [Candidatus Thorarchaeota archaeon]
MPRIERIKKRRLLKSKEQRDQIEELTRSFKTEISLPGQQPHLEEGFLEDGSRVIMLNGVILFFERAGRVFPSLNALLMGVVKLPTVTVDMGAVRYVVNGADIMRPGVTALEDSINTGEVVAVIDQTHHKPLAIGVSLMNAAQIKEATSGKVVNSVHHVGDEIWEFNKS